MPRRLELSPRARTLIAHDPADVVQRPLGHGDAPPVLRARQIGIGCLGSQQNMGAQVALLVVLGGVGYVQAVDDVEQRIAVYQELIDWEEVALMAHLVQPAVDACNQVGQRSDERRRIHAELDGLQDLVDEGVDVEGVAGRVLYACAVNILASPRDGLGLQGRHDDVAGAWICDRGARWAGRVVVVHAGQGLQCEVKGNQLWC